MQDRDRQHAFAEHLSSACEGCTLFLQPLVCDPRCCIGARRSGLSCPRITCRPVAEASRTVFLNNVLDEVRARCEGLQHLWGIRPTTAPSPIRDATTSTPEHRTIELAVDIASIIDRLDASRPRSCSRSAQESPHMSNRSIRRTRSCITPY